MNELKVKVCGMRDAENISAVALTRPDYMGFIFYPKSSRYVELNPTLDLGTLELESIKKIGVFVDEPQDKVISTCRENNLDMAQLHGYESPVDCLHIHQAGIPVIKAFSVDQALNFSDLEAFVGCCDFFLFDTKAHLPGGTGLKFNWQLLDNYQLEVPFFLSGGIRPDDLNSILQFQHPKLYGVDINSGFELLPALKDVVKLQQFIAGIRSKN